MPPRRGLGRGLDALIASTPEPTTTIRTPEPHDDQVPDGTPFEVDIDRIEANPRQPRQVFDEVAMADLADSIRVHGVLQPLLVSLVANGGEGLPRYQLIAGERRWQASRMIGLLRVPVSVRVTTPQEWLELALVENVQRSDLNALEAAGAYRQLATDFGMTHEAIGKRVGRSRHTITNTLRLLQLPPSVQQDLRDGDLTEGHARALLALPDSIRQREVASRVIREGLNVRQTEALVKRLLGSVAPPPPNPVETHPVAQRIRSVLGDTTTRVDLVQGRRGGKVVIHYEDDSQLERLYGRLASGTDAPSGPPVSVPETSLIERRVNDPT